MVRLKSSPGSPSHVTKVTTCPIDPSESAAGRLPLRHSNVAQTCTTSVVIRSADVTWVEAKNVTWMTINVDTGSAEVFSFVPRKREHAPQSVVGG